MRYGRPPIKLIQFDNLELLKEKGFLDGQLSGTLFRYPVQNKVLPIQITWKYRIYTMKPKKHLFSYVAEQRALLINDGIELDQKETELLISNLHLPFGMYWEDKTRNTGLQGFAIPGWRSPQSQSWVDDIMNWYKELPPGGELPVKNK